MFKPETIWQWLFIGIILVEACVVLGTEGWALYAFQSGLDWQKVNAEPGQYTNISDTNAFGVPISNFVPYSRSLPTFLALFIFGMIYMLGLSWDALRLKNTIQVIGICCFNWVLCIYAALQEVQIKDTIEWLRPVLKQVTENGEPGEILENEMRDRTVAVPAVLGVASIFVSIVGWKLYHEFAWTIYKHVSADLQLRKRYMIFEIYIAILKFDFFFFLAFTMEFLVLLSNNLQDWEFYITIAAVPVTVLILIAAAIIVRKENMPLQSCVLFVYLVGLVYFIFKLVRIWAGDPTDTNSVRQTYAPAAKPLTVLAVFTIAILLVTIGVGFKCLRNFGRGLKPYVNKTKLNAEDDKVYMNTLPNHNHPTTLEQQMPNRMVIE